MAEGGDFFCLRRGACRFSLHQALDRTAAVACNIIFRLAACASA
eukprot:CAMPEP_0204048586 /NCGR_PEP_ID=MMETSP0360-20130528/116062_1 /ASSEMBLY_ACC=CAM_ASM_000342 /TAXON_ID=268821 /ORGANISM="Scrippsiella Hangoei, Strain SHTV-5" /LENGTH=43 /DNA_ID= /DNA_START= /DNA_END= /DNA_ORIENTATION=